ncbi:MAG TPA: hypothetical protein VGF21_11085, partial [Thermoleophilaceae bacterium]
GARNHAVVLGFLACLLRPEIFPFLALYGLVLWQTEPALRMLIAGLAMALPLLWLVPEWIGSGDPFGGASQARSEPSWSLSLHDQPWLAVLDRWQRMAGLPLELAALAWIGFALRRRERTALVLAGVGLAWLGLVVGMTQVGFSGNGRYLLPPLVILFLLAGVGAARTVGLAGRVAGPAAALTACVLVALAASSDVGRRVRGFRSQARSVAPLATLHGELGDAVRRVGGPNEVTRYGAPTINKDFSTHLAWELEVPISDVESGRGDGVVFAASGRLAGIPPRVPRARSTRRSIGRVGAWSVSRSPELGLRASR